MATDTAQEKVGRAIRQIMMRAPYYGSLLSKMRIIEKDDCPTMMTDGRSIWWSTNFVNVLSWQEVAFVLMHEADHKTLLHSWRMYSRQPGLWNTAGDARINANLIEYCKSSSLPFAMPKGEYEGVLFSWVTDDDTTETIYDRLREEQNKSNGGFGNTGDLLPSEMDSSKSAISEIQAMQDILEAANTGKMMGSLPGHVAKIIDDLPQSCVNWRDEIDRNLRAMFGMDDWTYRRIRMTPLVEHEVLAPTLHGTRTGRVGIAMDTSGSMLELTTQCFGEVKAILEQVQPEETIVVQADTRITHEAVYTNVSELTAPEMHGGGGTCFVECYERLNELDCAYVIHLTDGHGTWPKDPPRGQLLVVLLGSGCAQPPNHMNARVINVVR